MWRLRGARPKFALLVRSQENHAPVLLDRAEDEHLASEVRDLLGREVHHRQDRTAYQVLLRIPRLYRRRGLLHAEGTEVDRETVGRVPRLREILHRQNAAHADVDLPELLPVQGHRAPPQRAGGGLRRPSGFTPRRRHRRSWSCGDAHSTYRYSAIFASDIPRIRASATTSAYASISVGRSTYVYRLSYRLRPSLSCLTCTSSWRMSRYTVVGSLVVRWLCPK